MRNPYYRFGLIGLVAALALGLVAFLVTSNPILSWWLGATVATGGLYRYDKAVAGSRRTRVPEAVLLMMEAVGGTLGAALAMWVIQPRHKTRSGIFLVWFFVVLAVQLLVIAAYWWSPAR